MVQLPLDFVIFLTVLLGVVAWRYWVLIKERRQLIDFIKQLDRWRPGHGWPPQ